jgi:hypothetical protein
MHIPIITQHAKKRLKERMGLAKRAHARHIQHVLTEGTFLYRNKRKNIFYILYNYKEYVFGLTNHYQPILITLYPKSPKGR